MLLKKLDGFYDKKKIPDLKYFLYNSYLVFLSRIRSISGNSLECGLFGSSILRQRGSDLQKYNQKS